MYSLVGSRGSAARHLQVDDWHTSASETDVETTAAAPAAESTGIFKKAISATTVLLFLAAAGSAQHAVSHAVGEQSVDPSVEPVSFNGVQQHWSRMGCRKWYDAHLKTIKSTTLVNCAAQCNSTANCYYYNWQPADCSGTEDNSGAGLGMAANTCMLFTAMCIRDPNPCWDLYQNPNPVPAWELTESRKGCANWDSMKFGPALLDQTIASCGMQCHAHAECTGFGFQPGPCSGDQMVAQNACYLYGGTCAYTENACWDYYTTVKNVSVSTTALATPANSTTIRVSSTSGFQNGNVITVRYMDGTVQHFTVVGFGSLLVDNPTKKTLIGGESVYVVGWRNPTTTTAPPSGGTTAAR